VVDAIGAENHDMGYINLDQPACVAPASTAPIPEQSSAHTYEQLIRVSDDSHNGATVL